MIADLFVLFNLSIVALLDIRESLDFGLQKGSQVWPVIFEFLDTELHVLKLLSLDILQVILSHLFVDFKRFLQLCAISLRFFADRRALLLEVFVHFGGIDVFLEAATRLASLPSCITAALRWAASCLAALHLSLLDAVFDLAVDHWFAVSRQHKAVLVDLDLGSVTCSDNELARSVILAWDFDTSAFIIAVKLICLDLSSLLLGSCLSPLSKPFLHLVFEDSITILVK